MLHFNVVDKIFLKFALSHLFIQLATIITISWLIPPVFYHSFLGGLVGVFGQFVFYAFYYLKSHSRLKKIKWAIIFKWLVCGVFLAILFALNFDGLSVLCGFIF